MERAVGEKLFDRGERGMFPTEAGQLLARRVERAIGYLNSGAQAIAARKAGRLTGALPLIRTRILPIAVTRLLAQYPDAKVKIIDAPYVELINHLRHGRIDLILGALRIPTPDNDLMQEELFRESLAIVVRAGHPVLKSRALDAMRLAKLDWVAPHPATPAGASFEAFFRRHGLPLPKRIIECSSFITVRDLLVRSDRAALLSASQIGYEALAGELAIAVPEVPDTERPIGICTRTDWSPTGMQSRFLALIREIVKESRPR